MKAGLLNTVVEILRRESVSSRYGGTDDRWVVDRKARANVNHKGGRLELSSQEAFASRIVEFELHYFQRIDYPNRIRHAGSVYSIEDIEYNRKTRRLIITAQRVNE